MAEIKLQDIQAQIQKFRKENPQKVKGLNDEQVVSIMVQQGAMPKETANQLAQILAGELVSTEGIILGQKCKTVTGKDGKGNLKSDIYIDFNGDNIADIKIFRQGNNVSIFASQQSNGQITGWTTTKDYDEYKTALLNSEEIYNELDLKRVPGNNNQGERVKYQDNYDSKGNIYKTKHIIPGDSTRAMLFEGATPEAQQAILNGEINLKDVDKYLQENQLDKNNPENAARLKYIEGCTDEEFKNFLKLSPEEQKNVDFKLRANQETTLRIWEDRISKFKSAEECQVNIDMLTEICKKEDSLDEIALVLKAMEEKLQTFSQEDIKKVKDPKWQEEMRNSREMNEITQETLWKKHSQMKTDNDKWDKEMSWSEKVGQWFSDDVEESKKEIEKFRRGVEELSKLKNLVTDEEFGKKVEELLGTDGYDIEHIKKVQKNHPDYVQITSASNTVKRLKEIANQEYKSMSLLHAEYAFGREEEIVKYIPNYKSMPPQDKFKALQELAKKTIPTAQKQFEEILGDRNYDEITKKHEEDYAKFLKMIGVSDVEKKLEEYKQEAAEAGGYVKCGVTIAATVALTIATGGIGGALGAGVCAGAASVTVNTTDLLSKDTGLLPTKEELKTVAKQGLVEGALTASGAKIGGVIFGSSMNKLSKFGASMASDTALGVTGDLILSDGNITLNGVLVNAAFAAAGNGIGVHAANKAQAKAKAEFVKNVDSKLIIDPNDGNPAQSNFPNLSKMEAPKTTQKLLNNKKLNEVEKAVLQQTYDHICQLGLKKQIDADPELLLNLTKNKYMLGVDATKLSKADIETMLYARDQYKKGLISEAEQNQVLERMNMGTPAELFKYIDTPKNLIPESVTVKRSWGENTYTKEQIIQCTKGDRVLRRLLDRQSTPADLTVHRVDDAAVHKNIKIGDKSLESLLAEGKSPEEIVKLINNSTSSSMQFDNFIGTSLGGVTGFTNKHSVRWEIDVPKGSKGAHLDSLVKPAEYMGENEFLLQAGTTLRIKEARYENGQFVLKAEAVQNSNIKTTQTEPTITPEQPNVAQKSSVPLVAEPTSATPTKKTTFTDEQINKIIEENNILGFDKPLLERLATHAPETLQDDKLKKLNVKPLVAKDIKDLAYLTPDLQEEYMRIRLINARALNCRLNFSGEATSTQLLNKIKNLSDDELINLDKTLKESTNPVELKKAMEKLGISSDDIPLNNNKELISRDRRIFDFIIYSGCDFSTTEINNLLQKGNPINVKIAIGQKVAQDISFSKAIINNGKEITLQQAMRIDELSLTGKKYTTDEINKIINAPEKNYRKLIDLYSNKPESYSLTLGEELRIDSQNTIIGIKGQNGYYPINFQAEAVQEFVKNLKEGEVYHVLNKNVNPNDTSLPYELCLIKKENGQIIIQNSFSDGLVINPTRGKKLNNISTNNNIIPDPTDRIFLRKECQDSVEKQVVLAKLLGNPELKNIDSQLIYDMYELNCTGKLYEKIINNEKITKQTLLDLKQEALLNKIKNTDDRTIMQELLNTQTINPEMVFKIMHSENKIFNKIKTEILADKKITTEMLDNITTETILEQIKQGKNKFSVSDKKIVDTILNSPYAKDFTPTELLNILNDDKYRGIALGKIRDGQPITKDLFPNCNKKITTSSLLDIANREIHKQTNINNRRFGKEYPEIKQSTIDKYYKNPQKYQEKLNKIMPAGEIRKSTDGTLYYNSGNELIKIGLDENTFKDIFPSSMNHRINQGSIGDCWLISTFGALMDNPVGRGQIYKLFSQQGDIISIKLPDAQTPVQFKREKIGEIKIKDKQGNIKTISNYSYKILSAENIKTDESINIVHGNLNKNSREINLNSSIGLRMLETACADLRADKLFNGSKMVFTPEEIINSFGADAVKKSLKSGFNIDAINMICGYKNNRIIEELNLRNKNIDEQIKILEKHVNNPNTIITFWTRGINDSFHWNKELDIIKQHAYRVVGINKAKQTITISNPHHNNKTIEIPFSEFLQYAEKCQILNIT